jgi:hypothetical protein
LPGDTPAAFVAHVNDSETPISADLPPFSTYPNVDTNGSLEYYRNLIYELYADVFVDKLLAQLRLLRAINHRIPIKIEKLWMAQLYCLPEHHKKALNADIDLKLHAGIIVQTTELPLCNMASLTTTTIPTNRKLSVNFTVAITYRKITW